MKQPFDKEITDFLIDRCDELDYVKLSPQYKKAEEETEELAKKIRDLLPESERLTLSRLEDRHGDRMTAAGNVAYQAGFSAGIKFLFLMLVNT